MAKKGMLLTISGPTGAKKDKVIEALLKKDNKILTFYSVINSCSLVISNDNVFNKPNSENI